MVAIPTYVLLLLCGRLSIFCTPAARCTGPLCEELGRGSSAQQLLSGQL